MNKLILRILFVFYKDHKTTEIKIDYYTVVQSTVQLFALQVYSVKIQNMIISKHILYILIIALKYIFLMYNLQFLLSDIKLYFSPNTTLKC